MIKRKIDVGPRTEDERRIFAWEETRIRLQHAVDARMRVVGWSNSMLADCSGLSARTIGRFFSDDCHVTVRSLIKIAHALELELRIGVVK